MISCIFEPKLHAVDLQLVRDLFEEYTGESPMSSQPLPQSGSSRYYLRLKSKNHSIIAAYAPDLRENHAFFEMSRFFKSRGVSVPELYLVANDKKHYLQQDLGDSSLFELLQDTRAQNKNIQAIKDYYASALKKLAYMQLAAARDFDYSVAYPRAAFDAQSVQWDLNYFKYYYLKLCGSGFDEHKLEKEFQTLIDILMQVKDSGFMFRDFQARNIMIKEGEVFFIDYQGGRQGAPQYDVASLLYQARAQLPEDWRDALLEVYLKEYSRLTGNTASLFSEHYHWFVLVRLLQTLGAYGFRGLYEQRPHFIKSIPLALKNLEHFLSTNRLKELPYLKDRLRAVSDPDAMPIFSDPDSDDTLIITLFSFSYKNGIPLDASGNGGGFVFDCRSLHNPGRYEAYKSLTGRDHAVQEFLEKEGEIQTFLESAYALSDKAVRKYLKRGFNRLMISFGCTGGQHRSVYSAELTAARLAEDYPGIRVRLIHRELDQEYWIKKSI